MKKATKWLIRQYILTCFSAFQYKKKKLQKEKGKLPAYIWVTSYLFAFLASLPVFWSEKGEKPSVQTAYTSKVNS